MTHKNQHEKAKAFYQWHHQSSTSVLPNAWDAISAKMFEVSGFKAIGTTSAGIATSLGYKDGQHIPFEKMVEVIRTIASSVKIPVSADIEAGYGSTIDEVVENMRKVIDAGAVGINLEDGTGYSNEPLYDISYQIEKISAIKKLSDSLFINARTDTYWLNIGETTERLQETIQRIKAYEEAGADGVFIPGLNDPEVIKKLREAVNCPINLLASAETPSLEVLSSIGIERVSTGSGPFRASATLLKSISEEIMDHRSFETMTSGVLSYGEVADLIGNHSHD